MFSYLGSKSKVVKYYPIPIYGKIIEPFAGSARYSLMYWDRDVVLIDKDPLIISILKYLQNCSKKDILSLPELKKGDHLDNYTFSCEEEKKLMGFLIHMGASSPGLTVSGMGEINLPRFKRNIVRDLHKIKNWTIIEGCYTSLKNEEATWFVDPPYIRGGHKYRKGNKDFNYYQLAKWCILRHGQVIVCENEAADWLPFVPMKEMRGTRATSIECVWSNIEMPYNHEQQKLPL